MTDTIETTGPYRPLRPLRAFRAFRAFRRSPIPGRIPALGMLMLALAAAEPGAQQAFTKADSGWVPLFNGRDFTGIYGRLYGQPVTETPDPSWIVQYPGTDTAVSVESVVNVP